MKALILSLILIPWASFTVGQTDADQTDLLYQIRSALHLTPFNQTESNFTYNRADFQALGQFYPESSAFSIQLDSAHLNGIDSVSGSYEKGYGITFTYTDQDQLSTETVSAWNEGAQAWIKLVKNEFNYDQEGNITLVIEYEFDDKSMHWDYSYKTENTWGAEGLLSTESHRWEPIVEEWEPVTKREYTYQFGMEHECLEYQWDPMSLSWKNHTRFQSLYANPGLLYQYKISSWHPVNKKWELFFVIEYSYDAAANHQISCLKNILIINGLWQMISKDTFTYNGASDLSSHTYLEWDFMQSQFVFLERKEVYYDAEQAIDSSILFLWDALTNDWVRNERDDYLYDKTSSLTEILFVRHNFIDEDLKMDLLFRYAPVTVEKYKWNTSQHRWLDLGQIAFYYSDRSTSYRQQPYPPLVIYPNPSTGYFLLSEDPPIFQDSQLTIFDLQGRTVLDQKLDGRNKINISSLRAGIYLVVLQIAQDRYHTNLLVLPQGP